jgi:hypothetical protein
MTEEKRERSKLLKSLHIYKLKEKLANIESEIK